MGALGNLIPLVILFLFVGGAAWVGYQVYLYTEQLAERGVKKMEKKNVVFSKDGARVNVKEIRAEDYADRTQKAFVKTWNAAQDGGEKKKTPSTSRSSSYTAGSKTSSSRK
ncbi:hypothetical protein K504DRAFT_465251 [Pleomassaria siparia CBS 279.74]|uniref:Uncharacterized protein n=1 Tax=Pleomassaria siparia CBS 279.74 TaxID=1314801 RepID=A0A6G1KFU7_9PLEO|nr:hypothetical protein K504DRAFT_465251 [Pleomassaria siparia CBS 279.74]